MQWSKTQFDEPRSNCFSAITAGKGCLTPVNKWSHSYLWSSFKSQSHFFPVIIITSCTNQPITSVSHQSRYLIDPSRSAPGFKPRAWRAYLWWRVVKLFPWTNWPLGGAVCGVRSSVRVFSGGHCMWWVDTMSMSSWWSVVSLCGHGYWWLDTLLHA